MTDRPPATRAECAGIARPCNRYLCRHNTTRDDESPGRPNQGKSPKRLRLHPKQTGESCSLDLADRVAETGGMDTMTIGTHLNLGIRRVEQLLARAELKLRSAGVIVEHVEALRDRLPVGAFVDSVFHAQDDLTGVLTVTVVVKLDKITTLPATSKPMRRRKPENPQIGVSSRHIPASRIDAGHLTMRRGKLVKLPPRDAEGNHTDEEKAR